MAGSNGKLNGPTRSGTVPRSIAREVQSLSAELLIGLDVGSTTVKAVVTRADSSGVLWQDYQRHETKQAAVCLEFLERIVAAFPEVPAKAFRIFGTGSGASELMDPTGGMFVQEVHSVALAVEELHPDAHSVIELGGQDAKILIFKEDPETGRKKKIPSMNDKCAGGTGAVIDKISAKLNIGPNDLGGMRYIGQRLHPVAGKCGVFAETDINGLQKQGVPSTELLASLYEAIVQQNLSVLTRGHTLLPSVLLLGGPNAYLRGLVECWRHHIPRLWEEREIQVPDAPLEQLIRVPEGAEYFAASGATIFGRSALEEMPETATFLGLDPLRELLEQGSGGRKRAGGTIGLSRSDADLAAFKEEYMPEPWEPAQFQPGTQVEAFLGIDAGSTSTKAVLIDKHRNVIAKAYTLSKGNPIQDTQQMVARLEEQLHSQDCSLRVLGAGTTGYAKDLLKEAIGADVALVETVAHTQSGLHFYPDAEVICDVGGQDIKVIMLKNGHVKDFKLNTQCSAGNGYFLQSTAADFGYGVEEFADAAFGAESMPEFGYGCAVFMQSDIVDFQRRGWERAEILAGLAGVLPKNIWLYVAQIPNLAQLGSTFILQGGTQRNLAAVKAQVDFIRSRFHGPKKPRVVVHRHCGESGAIGAGFEAERLYRESGHRTTFIGLEALQVLEYKTTRDENTRCHFCKNHCLRTFIDIEGAHGQPPELRDLKEQPDVPALPKSKVPLASGARRLIIATCEKGGVEDVDAMRAIKSAIEARGAEYPNLVDAAAESIFRPVEVPLVADDVPAPRWWQAPNTRKALENRAAAMDRRKSFRIGMPRALNMYSLAPFFSGYFQSLGVNPRNLVWSDETTPELYKEGAKRGSIDPCFPSKVAIPHVHNLLHKKHAKRPLDAIFFPVVDSFPSYLEHTQDCRACPAAATTPEAVHAAFIKEGNWFQKMGITFLKTFLNLDQPLLAARQMAEDWQEPLGVTEEESRRAVDAGLAALVGHQDAMRREARTILDGLEAEDRLGIVFLSRPYHHDPGVNHDICTELQQLGYPIFTHDSLPLDADILERFFGGEVAAGMLESPRSIQDVWKNSYSEHSSRKLWAAKYVARHPNLVGLEFSNFKCGHDAPIYTVMEEIIEAADKPFFYFRDMDENKAAGAVKIRVETIHYFLGRYQERLRVARASTDYGKPQRRVVEASVA